MEIGVIHITHAGVRRPGIFRNVIAYEGDLREFRESREILHALYLVQ